MISIIIKIIGLFCAIYGLFYIVTGLFGFIKRHKSFIKRHDAKHKFAVLVAARNEESIIEHLIHSLKKQDYPKYLYDIYVIPNNCTDNTEEVARKAGAEIINCDVPVKNKGDVLKFVFEKLKPNDDIDAYLVFDADNIVQKDFIRRMNDALCEGFEIAQGNRDSKNPEDSWVACLHSIFFWMQNIFVNRSRMFLKSSASLNGTGFMVKKSFIDEHGYNTFSITEDLEFTAQCILTGARIAYVEDAITYDEQPVDFKSSWVQRTRWSAGNMQCCNSYNYKLVKNFFKTMNFSAIDFAIKLLAPYVQIISTLIAVYEISMHLLNSTVNTFAKNFAADALGLIISYLFSLAIGLYIVIYYRGKNISKLITGVFLFPLYILSYLPIVIKCLFVKKIKWIEIKHTRQIHINELINKESKKQKSL